MEITGQIKAIFDTQSVSDRFKKREFVLTTEASSPYPQHVSFQAIQDKCELLDKFSEGQEVKVNFDLRGREWNGPQGVKYFNTLEAWRIEAVSGSQSSPASNIAPDNDDLPF